MLPTGKKAFFHWTSDLWPNPQSILQLSIRAGTMGRIVHLQAVYTRSNPLKIDMAPQPVKLRSLKRQGEPSRQPQRHLNFSLGSNSAFPWFL